MDYELMINGNLKIGQKAPNFNAVTTYGNRKLEDYKGKWLVFFSHPGDFTPYDPNVRKNFQKLSKFKK